MVKKYILLFYECFDHFEMAESIREMLSKCSSNNENVSNVECAVCLQTCVHPAELPCGHIFCYLCIKGIVNQGRRCAMCRQNIPVDYLNKPRLLKPMDAEITTQGFEDGHLWFYEGHNGWWQYDERTSLELESAYQKKERCCDLLIAGFLYVADFDGMIQYRKNDPSRRRRIKRDLATTTKKGIAGLKALVNSNSPEMVSNEIIQNYSASNSSVLNDFNGMRIFRSDSNYSGQIIEPTQWSQGSQNSTESSSRCSFSTCRATNPTNSNMTISTDSSTSYSRNLNLDTAIHDTLDWTIEQIESLNLELLNDYEALFRDVNNYEQLQDNLNQSRYRRTSDNYMSRYLNISNPINEPFENDLSSTQRVSDLCNLNAEVVNNSLYETSASSDETNFSYSEVNESLSNRSSVNFDAASPPPLPPPRNRGMSRVRLRRDSLQNSSNSNCETFLQKFISNE